MRLGLATLVFLSACIEPAKGPAAADAATPGALCDPYVPSDCASSESCQPAGSGEYRCTLAGRGVDQDACSEAPCRSGYVCAAPAASAHPVCLRPCHTDAQCPQDRSVEFCELALDASVSLCRPMVVCDRLVTPSPCEAGQKCSLDRLPGPFVCLPAGTLGDYESCTRESDCGPGYSCVSYGGAPSQCAALCYSDANCPRTMGTELCVRRNFAAEPPVLCERVTACIPAATNTCAAGQACYPYQPTDSTLHLEGICRTAGKAAQGESCIALNDCADGLVCFSPNTWNPPKCLPICSASASICVAPSYCAAITAHYGACW